MSKKLVLLLVVFLALHLHATTYYVAQTGNDSNDGSKAHPWLTIGKATATLIAGDSALVDTGAYTEQVTAATNGTSGSPIVYHANGAVTVHGDSASGNDYVELDGQYTRWEGFRVYNSSGKVDAIIIRGAGCRVTNCVLQFHNQIAEGVYVANSLAPNSGVILDHDSMLGFGGTTLNHGVYCASGGTTITHCYITSFGSCGIQLWYDTDLTNHCLVAWNTILNNHGDGIVVNGDTDVVHDNVFIGNGGDAQIILWYGSRVDSVYNNDCYAGTSDGLYLASAGPSIVLNNIILANATNIYTAAGDSSTVDYNCYWPDGNGMFGWGSNGGNFAAYKTGTGHDAHGICQNPLLADTTAHNFHEQASSPCIDVGDPKTPSGFDFDGVSTPQVGKQGDSAIIDMGAFEYKYLSDSLDAGVTGISAPSGTVDSGTVVTPSATVKNDGTKTVSFWTKMTIGTTYKDSENVSNLASGNSTAVTFANWTASPHGTFAVRCTNELANDQNHGNDTSSGSVTVVPDSVTDVGVTAIVAPPGTVDSGTVVTPKARVKNFGTSAATFPSTFRIGSSYTNTKTVTNLAAGDSVLVSFANWTARQRGTYTTRCSTALSGDQNHKNDTLSGSVTVKVTNVGVTAIIAPTGTIDSGAVVTPKAKVKNYGTNAATFPVKFRIGSSYSDSQTVTSLAAGDSVQVSFANWTATQRGTSTTRCTTALSGDQNHANDTLSGSVRVKVTNVGVTAIAAPTDTVDSGTVATPKARVRNFGTDTASFRTLFRIGSIYTDSQNVSNLAAGDSVTVSFTNWTPTQLGTFTKRCSTGLSGDQVHSNDTLSGSVTVKRPTVIDVGVTAILAPTGTVDSGTVVTPNAKVKNYGTNAATFPVKFRIGTTYTDSQTVNNLAAGDSVQVSFTNWTAVQRGTSATRCTTALSGDQHNNNDSLSGSVTVRVTNVGVTALVAPTGTIDSGTVVTPKARVKNFGTNAATFPVKFRIGSFYSDSQTVSNLAAGDSIQVSFTNWTAVQRGTNVTRCSTALSGDQNHKNDTLSGSVTVKVTNVGVTAVVAPTGTIDSGTVVTPKAKVKNYGTNAATFPVKFRIGSFYSDSQTVTSLAAGDSVQVSFTNWTATQRGTSTTRCTTALSGDQVNSNDSMSGTVRVKVTNVGVTALVAPTDTVDSGTVVTPKAKVKNFGTDAASFPTFFRIGSIYTDSQNVSSLAAGDSVTVSFTNWTPTQLGTFTTRCSTALSGDQVHSNDTLSGSVTVKRPTVIDVGVTAIVSPTGTIDSGTVVAPKAKVKNYGTNAATFPVKFRIGSFYSDSQTVSNLAAGDSIQVSLTNWTATQRGTSTTRCTTALNGDQHNNNDSLSGSVTVKVTNVGVSAIIAPTGTIDSGTVVTPKAKVKNYGTNAATFPVKFRIGSFYSDSQTVTSLAAGDSVQVSFTNWTATQRGTAATRCTTALNGDQVNSNDSMSGSVRVRVTNVGVTAIVAPTDTVDSGTVVTPKARVKNYGTDAASFPVKFRIDSFYSDSQNVTSLAAGDSALVSFTNWSVLQIGTHATRCSTALSGDQVHGNDTLSGTVIVVPAPDTDVGVTAIVAPTDTVDSGAVITPKAQVKNYGNVTASFPVTFRIGAGYSNTQSVSNLAAGDSAQVSFTNWTALQRGTAATRCSTALSGDQHHGNDTLSGSVTVRITNVGVTALVAPTDTVDSGTVVTPKARVRNFGTDAVTFPVKFRIGASYTDSQTVNNLAAGDSLQVSFSNWTAAPRGVLATRCTTALTGDQVNSNDSMSGSVTVKVTNVGVSAIIAPTGIIDSGTVVTPKAQVKNYGTNAATFPVFFRVGTSYTDSQNVSNLAAGDSVQVSFTNWTARQRGTSTTRCSTALSGDQNHKNDTLPGSVTVKVTNVGVTAIIAPTGTVDSGAVVTPQARVKNYGTDAVSFPVKFRIDSFYSDSENVTSLAAGDSTLVSFTNWSVLQIGTHTTRCSTALSGDQNHANDTLSGSVIVVPVPDTDVGVTAIAAPTGTVDSGTVITPKAQVRNYGNVTASFPVTFRIGAGYANTKTVSNLAAGDSVQVSFTNWTATQRGTSATRCSTALTGDQHHGNDTLSGSVTVRVTNVGVTAILAPTDTVDSGTVVTPQARVKNYGTNSATFPVTFRIGTSYTDSQTVSNLAAGDSVQVNFTNWTAAPYGVLATRCSTALTGDQNHSNDTLSGSVAVIDPDVGVTAIVAPTDTVDSGTVVTPQVRVKNYGTNAVTFPVFFRIGSFYSDSQTVSSLAAGDSVLVSFANWTAVQRGTSATRCSTALTGDQNHGNDTLSGSVMVVPDPVTDVGVTAITAPTDTVDSGTVVTPKAEVKNYGNNSATFSVKFRIGSFYSDSQTVSSLAAGDSVLVSFTNWTALQRGTSVTRCSTALTGDQHHGNDTLSGAVMVNVTNVGVTAIVAPTDTVDSGTVVTPQAWVRNYGSNAATFPVTMRIDTGHTTLQTVGANPASSRARTSAGARHANTQAIGTNAASFPVKMSIGATYTNTQADGTGAAPSPMMTSIGAGYSSTQTVTDLGPGDSVEVSFTKWTAGPRGLLAVRCSTGIAGDMNHANDTLSGSVAVRVIDVGVTAIIAPPDTVNRETNVTPQARVKNYGTGAASFPVTFRIDSTYSSSQNVTNLAPGDSALVTFALWTASQSGTFDKRCSTALTGDIKPANNLLSGKVTVLARRRHIRIVGINTPSGTYGPQQIVTPAATVRNDGDVPVAFEVWMILTDPNGSRCYTDSVSVANLDPANNLFVNTFRPCTLQLIGNWTAECSTASAGEIRLDSSVVTGGFAVRSAWVEMQSMSEPPSYRPVKDGAWLTYNAGSGLIYAAKGNNTSDFYSYNPATGIWTPLRFIPIGMDYKLPRQGACGTTDGNNYIYMAKGNNTLGFWRYDIAGDSWQQLPNIPSPGNHRKVKAGTAMVHVQKGDTGYIYLLKGNTNEFYRYNEQTYTWQYLQSALSNSTPKWVSGSFLVYDGDHTIYASKARYNELWTFSTQKDSWSTQRLNGMPLVGTTGRSRRSLDGGSGAWLGGCLYALKGGNTCESWCYDANVNAWTEFDSLPPMGKSGKARKVYNGGSMVNVNGTLYALKGNKTNELWCYPLGAMNSPQPSRDGVMAAQALDLRPSTFDIHLSPNPASGPFATLSLSRPPAHSTTRPLSVSLFDATGRRLLSSTVRNSSFVIRTSSLPAGVYLVKVTTEGFSTTQKLVIEH